MLGSPSWGIAWYVNGILIPELHLKRGETYTFRIAGGNDRSQGSKYHPVYITNDPHGGFEQTPVSVCTELEDMMRVFICQHSAFYLADLQTARLARGRYKNYVSSSCSGIPT